MARPPRSSTSATRSRSSELQEQALVAPPTSPAPRLRRAGGPSPRHPEQRSESRDPYFKGGTQSHTLFCLAPIPDLWPRFPPCARRYDREISPSLLQSEKRSQRPILGATRNLRYRSDFVGGAPCGGCPKSAGRLRRPRAAPARSRFRASATAHDPAQSGVRERRPSHAVSRSSRRSPSLQRPPTVKPSDCSSGSLSDADEDERLTMQCTSKGEEEKCG
jgi:hypothetical protein